MRKIYIKTISKIKKITESKEEEDSRIIKEEDSEKIKEVLKRYGKQIKAAMKHYKLSDPKAIIEIWNSKDHNGGLPHRYDDGDKECEFCLRPKDWQTVEIDRKKEHYYNDMFDVLNPVWINLKQAQRMADRLDSETKKQLKATMDTFSELFNSIRDKSTN